MHPDAIVKVNEINFLVNHISVNANIQVYGNTTDTSIYYVLC